jgi:hypothetical protein
MAIKPNIKIERININTEYGSEFTNLVLCEKIIHTVHRPNQRLDTIKILGQRYKILYKLPEKLNAPAISVSSKPWPWHLPSNLPLTSVQAKPPSHPPAVELRNAILRCLVEEVPEQTIRYIMDECIVRHTMEV